MATGNEEDVAGSALEERFQSAAERMRQNTALVLSNEHKLELYGFFKQVAYTVCAHACTCMIIIILYYYVSFSHIHYECCPDEHFFCFSTGQRGTM